MDMPTFILVVILFCAVGYFYLASVIEREPVKEFICRHQLFLHPNSLCVERVLLAFVGLLLYFYFNQKRYGIPIYTFSAMLDAVDGLVARACLLITEKGKWLDPLCDKWTYLPALYLFALKGILVMWLVALCIGVEIVGQSFARRILKRIGRDGAANIWGKIKTVLYFTLVIYCAILDDGYDWDKYLSPNHLLIACLVLSVASIAFKFIPSRNYADILSGLNLICGAVGTIITFTGGSFIVVVSVIIIGQIFDLFDGKCAQKYGGTKAGPMLDTVADSISFGVCPTAWYISNGSPWLGGIFGAAIVFRLYRYMRDKDRGGSCEMFVGLPSPAGAMLAFGVWPILHDAGIWLTLSMISVSYLTVSRIRFAHLGRVVLKHIPRPIFVLMGASSIICLLYLIKMQNSLLMGYFILSLTSVYIGAARFFKSE